MAIRRKRIEEITQSILRDQATGFETNLEKISKKFGILIKEDILKDSTISGFLFNDSVQPIIGVNAEQSETRKRFTIAHELGHFILHNQKMTINRRPIQFRDARSEEGIHEDEIEANHFAACILLPKEKVESYLEKNHHHEVGQEEDSFMVEMSKKFNVSMQSLILRLNSLGYFREI